MKKKHKVTVILLPTGEGTYQVFFPHFPNCLTEGETAEEALRNAKESLELHLEDPTEDDLECLKLSHAPHVVISEIEVVVQERTPLVASYP